MKDIILFIILFIILTSIHYYIINNLTLINKSNKNYLESIKYNIDNQDFLEKSFDKIIKERISLLKNKFNNNYEEWIKYNSNNNIINIDGHIYFLYIVEKINNTQDFILKIFPNKEFNNFTLNNVADLANQKAYFTRYSIDKYLYDNMYNSAHPNIINKIKYTWINPYTNKLVEKISVYNKFNLNSINGVIGIGYDYEDIKYNDTFFYYSKLDFKIILVSILFTFVFSFLSYKISHKKINKIKIIIFLIMTNLFITYFISIKEQLSTTKLELEKLNSFNQSVLSISFLFAVNIFIIKSMIKKSEYHRYIFIESSLLFVISLILVLMSIFKNVNFQDLNELIITRIQNQFYFNFSIIINIFILINFIIYIIYEKNLS